MRKCVLDRELHTLFFPRVREKVGWKPVKPSLLGIFGMNIHLAISSPSESTKPRLWRDTALRTPIAAKVPLT